MWMTDFVQDVLREIGQNKVTLIGIDSRKEKVCEQVAKDFTSSKVNWLIGIEWFPHLVPTTVSTFVDNFTSFSH